ncbi:MAG: tetratricopeptide repeat protein [Synergistaceae bacterium]|nr:tetratricopeptide repeat protein [Synergistaceae bacterium]
MWVIAGREKLRWADINPEWSDSLEQHMLGNLSYHDAKYFLSSAGINDEAMTAAIYKLTSGTPVFLDLCVDNYYSIIERGKNPVIDDFKGSTTVIIERFLRYMDDSRKDMVYLLSCMKVWDDETFHTIAGEVMTGYSFTTYEKIKGASFITKGIDGNYTMHQTVQSVVYSDCPAFIRGKADDALRRYYAESLRKTAVTSPKFSVMLSRFAGFIVSRSFSGEDFSAIYSGLSEYLNKAMDSCQFDLLLSCMGNLTDYAEENMPGTEIAARLYNDYAKDLTASGRYGEALERAMTAEGICREIFGETDERTLEAVDTVSWCLFLMEDYKGSYETAKAAYEAGVSALGEDNPVVLMLLKELGTSCDHLGRYEEALRLKQKLFEKRKSLSEENHPDTLTAMQNLANNLSNLGRYQEALKLRREVLAKRIELLGENHPDTVGAMHNLAISYSSLGQYEEALKLRREVLAKYTELLGENHPNTVTAMGNLANTYDSLRQYEEALKLKREVLAKYTEILGENHPDTLTAMLNLANTLWRLERYQESLELGREVLAKHTELFGKNHPDTVRAMHNLAISYSSLGQHEEALRLRREVLAKRTELLGENHPDTVSAMNNLANTYNRLHDYVSALPLARKALEMEESIFGKGHIKTTSTLDTVSEALSGLGQHSEAIRMQEESVRIREQILGETHPQTIEYLENLAKRFRAAGDEKKASEFEERVKSLREKANQQNRT